MEKIVVTQLIDYFVGNAYFTPSLGYLQLTQLLNIVDYIYNSFDSCECTGAVFLDFAKAFDSLDRNVLFAKLEYYGIKGVALNWFKSYFSDRKQFVKYRGVESELLTTRYGTAQGSVFGLLLYLIFVNDNIVHCSGILKFTMYADHHVYIFRI